MEFQTATRKPFPVKAVQITLQNVDEVAAWCKGTVEMRPTRMMGTLTPLPVIVLKGQGTDRGKDFEAALGCWIIELKGNFRSYKPAQFESAFDLITEKKGDTPDDLQKAEEYLAGVIAQNENSDEVTTVEI